MTEVAIAELPVPVLRGEDYCIVCEDNLATQAFPCGHRDLCLDCYTTGMQRARNGLRRCPICRHEGRAFDTTTIQLNALTLRDGVLRANDVGSAYPFGCQLVGPDRPKIFATAETIAIVRQEIERLRVGELTYDRFHYELRSRLTIPQLELAFQMLLADEDFHDVIKRMDTRNCETVTERNVRTIVRRTIEGYNFGAVLTRSLISTTLLSGLFLNQGFLLFSGVELYRWATGKISRKDCFLNIGEHCIGSYTGVVGAFYGFEYGAIIGTFLAPGVGSVIGAILGVYIGGFSMDAAGRCAYRVLVPRTTETNITEDVVEERPCTPMEIAQKAADKFGVKLEDHTFGEAQRRYRRMLLANHPDKFPDASIEEKEQKKLETTDILACWEIVREYYEDHPHPTAGDNVGDVDEGFLTAFVLKVKDAVTGQWKAVRSWWGELGLGRDLEENERVDQLTLYI
jgi:hypothetical protein